jgi:hypothetical protein
MHLAWLSMQPHRALLLKQLHRALPWRRRKLELLVMLEQRSRLVPPLLQTPRCQSLHGLNEPQHPRGG